MNMADATHKAKVVLHGGEKVVIVKNNRLLLHYIDPVTKKRERVDFTNEETGHFFACLTLFVKTKELIIAKNSAKVVE